jgi:prephenate dehydrogenase
MKRFNKITIIGVGLIGGSIGLAIKKRKLAKVVCGVGRRLSSLRRARAKGAVDTITLYLGTGIKDADIVIIATPISLIPQYALRIAGLCWMAKKDLIVTDVGSTKDFIVSRLQGILPPGLHFVGSHPFAGSEKSGAASASADLLREAKVFLTPTRRTDKTTLNKVRRFWQALGSHVILMSPKKHDELVGVISHLPHILAAALVNSASARDASFASTGFLDTTRIAAGDPLMWRDICLSNSKNILKAIHNFKKDLTAIEKAIEKKDIKTLMQQLEAAKKKREAL